MNRLFCRSERLEFNYWSFHQLIFKINNNDGEFILKRLYEYLLDCFNHYCVKNNTTVRPVKTPTVSMWNITLIHLNLFISYLNNHKNHPQKSFSNIIGLEKSNKYKFFNKSFSIAIVTFKLFWVCSTL